MCGPGWVPFSMHDRGPLHARKDVPSEAVAQLDIAPSDQEPEQSQGRPATIRRFSFHAHGRTLFGIHIVNVFLTLLSCGLYYFWAKVKTRSFLYRNIELEQDRFTFDGTGKEIFLGFMKAILIFGLPYAAIQLVPELLDTDEVLKWLASLLGLFLILVLIPRTVVTARRYRMSRSAWRGIRFSFQGKVSDFIYLYLRGWGLTLISLGAYYPFFLVKQQAFLISHSYLGSHRFHFAGRGSDLAPSFVLAYLLFPITLGFSWIWYLAKKHRFLWGNTYFANARFQSTVTAWSLFRLKAGNLLLLLLTLGLAWPWATVRILRFFSDHVSLVGQGDLDGIVQRLGTGDAMGEGLDEWLETGFDFG